MVIHKKTTIMAIDILIHYKGNYNFDLDNSIIFGLEREDDSIGYNANSSGRKT